MVRHHMMPLQTQRHPELGPFLYSSHADGFHIDDFATNGMLLPLLSSVGRAKSLPVHFGGHPRYNEQIIVRLQTIRVFCESIRSDRLRRQMALVAVRGVQKRAKDAIVHQGVDHVDYVNLAEPAATNLVEQIARLVAQHSVSSI